MLAVEDLHVDLPGRSGMTKVVRGVSLSVAAGETLAIVGESGSGKSITALSIMGLLPAGARRRVGRLAFEGEDLDTFSDRRMEDVRGRRIGKSWGQGPNQAFDRRGAEGFPQDALGAESARRRFQGIVPGLQQGSGSDHDRRIDRRVAQGAEQLEAIHAGHVDIKQDQRRDIVFDCLQGRRSAVRQDDPVTQVAKHGFRGVAEIGIVIDHQDQRSLLTVMGGTHGSAPIPPRQLELREVFTDRGN